MHHTRSKSTISDSEDRRPPHIFGALLCVGIDGWRGGIKPGEGRKARRCSGNNPAALRHLRLKTPQPDVGHPAFVYFFDRKT